ncbi:MAG: methyltransferase domain-containing protein [bacterium]|nr:methyltransferase domain-containing protein [bacterium]
MSGRNWERPSDHTTVCCRLKTNGGQKVTRRCIIIWLTIMTLLTQNKGAQGAENVRPPLNAKRALLSEVRGGDYAHAGDTEAIDLILKRISQYNPQLKEAAVLDVGCGFGGTLNYLSQKGFTDLTGVDLSDAALHHAQTKYSKIPFLQGDALQLNAVLGDKKFDLIYLMNVAYALPDKSQLLQSIKGVSKPGTILILFDYMSGSENALESVVDFAGGSMHPIHRKEIVTLLEENGWDDIIDEPITNHYERWYVDFLDKLSEKRHELSEKFQSSTVDRVEKTFSSILDKIRHKQLGGVIVSARWKGEPFT